VDAKLPVTARNCAQRANGSGPVDPQEYTDCMATPPRGEGFPVNLDAYKKLGQGFATLGGGAVFAITPKLGVQLNVNFMVLFPSSGFAIQPSLGGVYGL
jgi:hypothetical protein